jgi:hypothetical protein
MTAGIAFRSIEFGAHRNNVGITACAVTGAGRMNVWRNSLPAEEFPGGSRVVVDGVPFDLPPADGRRPDNVRCAGQLLPVPPGRYDWIHVLACGERRVEDEVVLHFSDETADFEALRVSDFWAAEPAFGESVAFVSSVMHYPQHVQPDVPAVIWYQRVPVTRRAELVAVGLPRNSAVHIFAATLQ